MQVHQAPHMEHHAFFLHHPHGLQLTKPPKLIGFQTVAVLSFWQCYSYSAMNEKSMNGLLLNYVI